MARQNVDPLVALGEELDALTYRDMRRAAELVVLMISDNGGPAVDPQTMCDALAGFGECVESASDD